MLLRSSYVSNYIGRIYKIRVHTYLSKTNSSALRSRLRNLLFLSSKLYSWKFLRKFTEYVSKTEVIHNKKLSNLGIRNKLAPCDPMKVVHNFSGLHFSAKLRTILAYGLDFSLPFYKLYFYRYFLPIERLVLRLSRDDHVPNTSELIS